MKNLFQKSPANPHAPTAKVSEGNLVLSLPTAISPVVWRWNLAQAQSAALEITQDGTHHVLRMKSSDGKNLDIAAFDNRDKALAALMAASEGMDNQNTSSPIDRASEGAKWLIALIGVAVVIGMFMALGRMTPSSITPYVADTAATPAATSEGAAGVPVSADNLLEGLQ